MSDSQAEALESLVAHPGWAAFLAHIEQEWGDGGVRFRQEMTNALNLTDNNAAASQARQILSAQGVIRNLIRWPSDELAKARRAGMVQTSETMSRRGGL